MTPDSDWMRDAACRISHPNVFHPAPRRNHRGPISERNITDARNDAACALKLCGGCPVTASCLAWADAHETEVDRIHGVFGGLTELERRVRFKDRNPRNGPAHGTVQGYWRGCVCGPCKEAADIVYGRREGA